MLAYERSGYRQYRCPHIVVSTNDSDPNCVLPSVPYSRFLANCRKNGAPTRASRGLTLLAHGHPPSTKINPLALHASKSLQ